MVHRSKLRLTFVLCAALAGCSDDDLGRDVNPTLPRADGGTGLNPAPIDSGTSNPPTPAVDSSTPTPTPSVDAATPKPDASTPTPSPEAGAADSSTDSATPDASTPDATTPDATTPVSDAGDGGGTTPDGGPGNFPGADPTEATIMANGPCGQSSYTSGFRRAAGVDSSTVWVPGDKCAPPWASVAIVPGFVSPESSIREWGPFLASHGIVAVTIGVPGGDQPNQRATKLMGTLESIKAEDTRSGSPLMGKLDLTRQGVAGWSMGGGGTLINAASFPDKLKAAVSFAAWGPSGGSRNKTPVLMFEATADALAAGMSDGFFRDTPATTPKMLFEVQGSSHNVANSPKNHGNVIGAYGLSWFKTYLVGDTRYKKFLLRPFPSICTRKSAHNLM
jgi:dienelactone hydrolase